MSLEFIIAQSLIFIMPLLIVALAGLYSEKSGTVNIGLEGMMVMGAFAGVLFINRMQGAGRFANTPQLLLIFGLLVAAAVGLLLSILLAFLAIKMKADQTIGGTAINLLAVALVIFLSKALVGDTRVPFTPVFEFKSSFLSGIPFLNYILFDKAYLTTYIVFAILLLTVFIFRSTKFGLRLSACGEHPQAAQSAGINVIRYRWIGVLISGFLAGMGGLIYVIPSSASFDGTVSGYGFLALGVLIFGQWKPVKILWAAIFFGFFKTLSVIFFGISFIASLTNMFPNFPFAMIFRMLPFLATMVVLAITSKKSRAPKAAGIPFDPLST